MSKTTFLNKFDEDGRFTFNGGTGVEAVTFLQHDEELPGTLGFIQGLLVKLGIDGYDDMTFTLKDPAGGWKFRLAYENDRSHVFLIEDGRIVAQIAT